MRKVIFLVILILLSGCSIRSYSSECGCNKVHQTSIDVGVSDCDESGCLQDEW